MLTLVLICMGLGFLIIGGLAFWRGPLGFGWRRPAMRRGWGGRVRPVLGPRPWRRGWRRW